MSAVKVVKGGSDLKEYTVKKLSGENLPKKIPCKHGILHPLGCIQCKKAESKKRKREEEAKAAEQPVAPKKVKAIPAKVLRSKKGKENPLDNIASSEPAPLTELWNEELKRVWLQPFMTQVTVTEETPRCSCSCHTYMCETEYPHSSFGHDNSDFEIPAYYIDLTDG